APTPQHRQIGTPALDCCHDPLGGVASLDGCLRRRHSMLLSQPHRMLLVPAHALIHLANRTSKARQALAHGKDQQLCALLARLLTVASPSSPSWSADSPWSTSTSPWPSPSCAVPPRRFLPTAQESGRT